MNDYVPPVHGEDGFHCPFCQTFAHQLWHTGARFSQHPSLSGYYEDSTHITLAKCSRCGEATLWVGEKMVHPETSMAPMPHPDMPSEVLDDLNEARAIVGSSPRAAAALLRLVTEKLVTNLEPNGKDLNAKIGNLVEEGLPVRIAKSLDILRVIGNESVHPGLIDLNDTPDMAQKLFKLINMIVEDRISLPGEVDELYETLPENKREAIEKRNERSVGLE